VITRILLFLVLLSPIVGAVFLARSNFVHGRGDRRGAMRLAVLVFALHMAVWLFQTHFSSVGNSIGLLFLAVSTALLWGGGMWMLYLAIEPYVRRYWPQALISWTRALDGRWRDPLVGRDVLYGTILGLLFCDLYGVRFLLVGRLGAAPLALSTDYLGSARLAIGAWSALLPSDITFSLFPFLLLFFWRILVRKPWLAAAGFVLVSAAIKSVPSDYPAVDWPMQIILYSVLAAGAVRYGLVTLAVALFTADMALNLPVTLNTSAWYFPATTLALASIAALAIWGFYTALAGQAPSNPEPRA
jgi:hypothetical protein